MHTLYEKHRERACNELPSISKYPNYGMVSNNPRWELVEHLEDALKRADKRHVPAPMNLTKLEHVIVVE